MRMKRSIVLSVISIEKNHILKSLKYEPYINPINPTLTS